VTKIGLALVAALLLLPLLIAALAQGVLTALLGTGSARVSGCAPPASDIPPAYCLLYVQAAATCPGLDWTVLAAIGKIETDHGRSRAPGAAAGENTKGAAGPMQFLHDTFDRVVARHGLPPGGARPPSRYNAHDAIYAAAYFLCDTGADHGDLRRAIFAYNHADWYVDQVLTQTARYSYATPTVSAACGAFPQTAAQRTVDSRADRAMVAVRYACAQLGKPYVWGGNGEPGFDCSGLTAAAYAAAGIALPRTAQAQYNAGPLLPAGTPPQPGDLVFFGTPSRIHHVGMSLGGTQMVNAPTFGTPVQVQNLRDVGDYAGASRPAG
jgi:cell wall-associated NlpC family hydrolase